MGTKEDANAFFQSLIDGAEDATKKAFWTQVRDQAVNKAGNGTSLIDMQQFYLEALLSDEGKQIFGTNEQEYQEMLTEMYKNTVDLLKDTEDKYENLLDDILEGYDDIAERMEYRSEQMDYQLDSLEHQRDLIEMIHGEDAYDLFGLVNEAQINASLLKVEEVKRNYDY